MKTKYEHLIWIVHNHADYPDFVVTMAMELIKYTEFYGEIDYGALSGFYNPESEIWVKRIHCGVKP